MPDRRRNLTSPSKKRLALMLKALGNATRFQIVEMLSTRRVCITSEIVECTDLVQSTVSQHLRVLREAGLVQCRTYGPATQYSIDPENIRWLKEQFRRWLPEYSSPEE